MSSRTIELRRNYSLRDFTAIKIGGEAKFFFIINAIDELRSKIKDIGQDYYLLGAGSNLLVSDTALNKAVLKLGSGFDYVKINTDSIEVGAATPLSKLLHYTVKNKFGGLENLVCIPATIGGLLIMNASSYGRQISDLLKEVEFLDKEGNIKKLKKQEIVFSYRSSSLKGAIILRAWFILEKTINLREKVNYFIHKRLSSQDFNYPSCGCIFKNPQSLSAGLLIDSCGLKGLRRNGAQISPKHANFIINLGQAAYKDVDYLIECARDRVHRKFAILLEEEIERWA
jgi:UDP-N-acetylmuramate dehydrogenase